MLTVLHKNRTIYLSVDQHKFAWDSWVEDRLLFKVLHQVSQPGAVSLPNTDQLCPRLSLLLWSGSRTSTPPMHAVPKKSLEEVVMFS